MSFVRVHTRIILDFGKAPNGGICVLYGVNAACSLKERETTLLGVLFQPGDRRLSEKTGDAPVHRLHDSNFGEWRAHSLAAAMAISKVKALPAKKAAIYGPCAGADQGQTKAEGQQQNLCPWVPSLGKDSP